MNKTRSFQRPATTRADVVMTVLALGLLVPLIVAALHDTGEQARIAQCLSNLGHIGHATQLYSADYEDDLPPVQSPTGSGIAEWFYGGKTNADYWKETYGGAFFAPVTTRPLNAYLLGAQPQPDVVQGSQILRRTPMPMFACPSDRGSHQRNWADPDASTDATCYDDVGTSYLFNLFAVTNLTMGKDAASEPSRVFRELVLDGRAGRAHNMLLYLEDPMMYGIAQGSDRIQTMGNHGRWSWHAAAYLDGHADYRFMDTRGCCGPGWAAINTNWVRLLGQPKPPIYYSYMYINCAPPQD